MYDSVQNTSEFKEWQHFQVGGAALNLGVVGEAGVAARWVGGCVGQTCIACRWVNAGVLVGRQLYVGGWVGVHVCMG